MTEDMAAKSPKKDYDTDYKAKMLKLEETYDLKELEIKQNALKEKLITTKNDRFDSSKIKYIGGVDISFSSKDENIACVGLVIIDFKTLKQVYEDSAIVKLDMPYIPGFLGFREVKHITPLFDKLKNTNLKYYPDVVMVDGNGILHPRGFGSACHLGVELNICTIGIGKTYFHLDGFDEEKIKEELKTKTELELKSNDKIVGAAFKSTTTLKNCIYVSVGHKLDLTQAMEIVRKVSKFKVPEPLRLIDHSTREKIKKHDMTIIKV